MLTLKKGQGELGGEQQLIGILSIICASCGSKSYFGDLHFSCFLLFFNLYMLQNLMYFLANLQRWFHCVHASFGNIQK